MAVGLQVWEAALWCIHLDRTCSETHWSRWSSSRSCLCPSPPWRHRVSWPLDKKLQMIVSCCDPNINWRKPGRWQALQLLLHLLMWFRCIPMGCSQNHLSGSLSSSSLKLDDFSQPAGQSPHSSSWHTKLSMNMPHDLCCHSPHCLAVSIHQLPQPTGHTKAHSFTTPQLGPLAHCTCCSS